MKEFTKFSVHNHFGGPQAELKLHDQRTKSYSFDFQLACDVVDEAHAHGYKLLGFTNANIFRVNDYIKTLAYAKNLGITILPGIEINLKSQKSEEDKYLHVVILFDPRSQLARIANHISENVSKNDDIYLTIEQFVKIDVLAKCIIIPHGIKQSGSGRSAVENIESFSEILAMKGSIPLLLDGYKEFHKEVLINKIKKKLSPYEQKNLTKIPMVAAADRRKFSQVSDPSYFWGEPTFNDLYYSAIMEDKRVFRQGDIIEKEKYIDKIEIVSENGAELEGAPEIIFSHGLNSIIGPSGSGKTLLLNFIYNTLKGEDMSNLSTSECNYESIYSKSCLKLYDSNDNLIKKEDIIALEGDDLYKTLTMNYRDNKHEMFNKFNIHIDSKNFKNYIKYFSVFSNQYVDNRIRIKGIRNDLKDNLKNVRSNFLSIQRNQENSKAAINYSYDHKIGNNMNALESSLEIYEKDLNIINSYYAKLDTISRRYDFEGVPAIVHQYFQELKEKIRRSKLRNRIEYFTLKNKKEKQDFIKGEVQNYNKKTGRAGEVVVKAKQDIKDDLEKVKSLLYTLKTLKSEIIVPVIEANSLQKEFEKGIRIENNFTDYNIEKVNTTIERQSLKDYFPGNIGQRKSQHKLGETAFSDVDKLELNNACSVSNFLEVFVTNNYQGTINILDSYDDYLQLDIQVQTNHGNYQSVKEISAGQLGKIYFRNMIEKKIEDEKVHILFFDQPENNLEKNFILNELTSMLNTLKSRLQIIITTHEPLLVINADSNNIIVADNHKTVNQPNNISYENVSLIESIGKDSALITISELIDGSIEAVKKRNEIYGGVSNENNN